ncbi:MAG: serine hydrolase domain-containing protein, partial [Bacteroidota bacterium]
NKARNHFLIHSISYKVNSSPANKSLLLCLFTAILSIVYGQENTSIDRINQYLNTLAADKNFSLCISISHKDSLVLERAFGYANRAHQVPNQMDTKLNTASIGKMFTAVAILQLEEQQKIDLQYTVGTYLPQFPNKAIRDAVSIYQLLTHTSGLPLWFSEDYDQKDKFDYLELADYLAFYEDYRIDSSKVGTYAYSNVGFMLLGYIIEEVAQMSYKDYLNQYLFEPLDMQHTGLWKLTDIIPNAAVGYVRPVDKKDEWKTNYYLNKSSSPAGGAYSSTGDLIKFYQGLKTHQLLKEESKKQMFHPQISTGYGQYGYGIGINENNGQAIIGHLGGYYGVRGELMWYPTDDYIVAILANSDHTDYIDLSYFIKTELTGTEEEKRIYQQTLNLLASKRFEQTAIDSTFLAMLEGKTWDEMLIQIKAYHYYNNKDYEKAKKYFYFNHQLFPESASAMNDWNRVKE